MNTSELTDLLSTRAGLSRAKAHAALAEILSAVAGALVAGESVRLTDLGTLKPVDREARSGTGPDGQPYTVGPRRAVRFKAAKLLDAALNP